MVLLEVHAHAGETLPGDSALIYTPGAPTVTFSCFGTTLNFHCQVDGQSEMTDEDVQLFLDGINSVQ